MNERAMSPTELAERIPAAESDVQVLVDQLVELYGCDAVVTADGLILATCIDAICTKIDSTRFETHHAFPAGSAFTA